MKEYFSSKIYAKHIVEPFFAIDTEQSDDPLVDENLDPKDIAPELEVSTSSRMEQLSTNSFHHLCAREKRSVPEKFSLVFIPHATIP